MTPEKCKFDVQLERSRLINLLDAVDRETRAGRKVNTMNRIIFRGIKYSILNSLDNDDE